MACASVSAMDTLPPPDFKYPLSWKLRVMKVGDSIEVKGRPTESVRTSVSRYASDKMETFRVTKENGHAKIERTA